MKTLSLTILLSASLVSANAQDTLQLSKFYRNEFGIDASSFIKEFISINNSNYPSYYYPTYYLTYRRHFKFGNIRFATGGEYSHRDLTSPYDNDVNHYESNYITYDARIGWEFFDDLSKRWQVFYGVDFRPSLTHRKNDASQWNAGYAYGYEDKGEFYGVAPVLGFRFKITPRLSISTETTLALNWETITQRRYFTPSSSQYAPLPDETTPAYKRTYTMFYQPVFLILTFDI